MPACKKGFISGGVGPVRAPPGICWIGCGPPGASHSWATRANVKGRGQERRALCAGPDLGWREDRGGDTHTSGDCLGHANASLSGAGRKIVKEFWFH